jgi:hypothetical protein
VVSLVGGGLAILVLAATADPVPLLRSAAGAPPGRHPGPLLTAGTATASATGTATSHHVTPYDLPWVRPLVLAVLAVVGLLMLAGTVAALVQVAKRLWEERWRAPDVPLAQSADQLDVPLAASHEAVLDAAEQLQAAFRAGTPRNGGVQCWVVLLRTLEEHGVAPDPAQSPTELTRHALQRVSTDRTAVAELTSLFLEARFSEHTIGEASRRRAEVALRRVLSGLDRP